MISTANESTSFRFSTDALPARARGKAVRELHEHPMLAGKLEEMEPLPECSVRADITQRALPGLGILSGTLRGLCQQVRPERSAHNADDNLYFGVNVTGSSIAC